MSLDIQTQLIQFKTEGFTHMYDITAEVQQIIRASGFREGQVCVIGIGSTTGVSTVEFEPGLAKTDIKAMMDQFAPYGKSYAHNRTWGDDNGAAHLRSFMVGTSFNAPFVDGELVLGTWQQIVFLDFDTRPRNRKIAVQIFGK